MTGGREGGQAPADKRRLFQNKRVELVRLGVEGRNPRFECENFLFSSVTRAKEKSRQFILA